MMWNRTSAILAVLLIVSLAGNAYLAVLTSFGQEGGGEVPSLLDEQGSVTAEMQGSATLQGPAVIQKSSSSRVVTEGTMINISVDIQPGKGRVLVETEPLMGIVFQDAAKTAVMVAENTTGTSLAESDVIFSVEAREEIPAVDGPSAGALMAALVLSALDHQALRQDVTLTGTIDTAGHVGAIGGVVEKAQAAEERGKSLILLPRENAQLVQYSQTTKNVGRFTIPLQSVQTVDAKEYIERVIGIQVEYVDSIQAVEEYLEE